MTTVRFDDLPQILRQLAQRMAPRLQDMQPIFAIRDLWARIRFVVAKRPAVQSVQAKALADLAQEASEKFGAHAFPPTQAILYGDEILADLESLAAEPHIAIGTDETVFRLLDRQVTGQSWATVRQTPIEQGPHRIALYSLKGGVGRSTATALTAWHLARKGHSVLVLDLDLEAPGLSSSLLPEDHRPDFGIVDWLVEDAVGQGSEIIPRMSARGPLAQNLEGELWIVPSHGLRPGDFLAKLGRAYLDLPGEEGVEPWESRLRRLLMALETDKKPDFVLLDARSGFHDLASTAVTDLATTVLLFAVGSTQTWDGYDLLFDHWLRFGMSEQIRERLQIVAAMIPEFERENYLEKFQEKSWDLFSRNLYDEVRPGELGGFSFDLHDTTAPHSPLKIFWNRGLVAPRELIHLDPQLVEASAGHFMENLDSILADAKERA